LNRYGKIFLQENVKSSFLGIESSFLGTIIQLFVVYQPKSIHTIDIHIVINYHICDIFHVKIQKSSFLGIESSFLRHKRDQCQLLLGKKF
jgi:hypothetical protein